MGKVGDASVFRLALFPAYSLPFPLTRLAGSFTTPPPAVSSPLKTPADLPCSLPPPVDPLPPEGPAPLGVLQVDPLPGAMPVEVAGDSGAARGAASGGAASRDAGPGSAKPGAAESEGAGSGGAEPGGAEPGGAEPAGVEPGGAEPEGVEPEGVEPGGAEFEGAESGGAEPLGTASSGGPAGASQRLSPRPEPLSPQQLREWFAQRTRLRSGAGDLVARDTGAGGVGATCLGGAGVTFGAGGTGGDASAGSGGARTTGTGAGGAGAGEAGVGATGAADPRAGRVGAGGAVSGGTGARGTLRPRPYFVPLIQQVLGVPSSTGLTPPLLCPPLDHSQPPVFLYLLLQSPLFLPSLTLTLTLLVVLVPLSLISSQVLSLSTAASALIRELPEIAVACRLDYATALLVESDSATPQSVRGECALGTDVLEDKQEDFECLAAAVPCFASRLLAPEGDRDASDIPPPRSYAEWQAAMDAEMASWKSTGTYVDVVPPSRANIVNDMWIFRVKRPPGSPPAFKARYVARGFSQRHGVDYLQTFSPTPKMTTLWVLLHVAALCDYELHSLDFSTAFLQGSLHEEI
ncbi:unnamed protein product [Closterium sp. NIES-54]